MEDRAKRILELVTQSAEIEKELDAIRAQMKEEKLALSGPRKTRKKKQGDLPI